MFKEKLKKIKSMLQGKDDKRKIENIVVFIVILVITIIIINTIWTNESEKETEDLSGYKVLAEKVSNEKNDEKEVNLETKLENILSKMDGVGKVSVMITYSQNSEIIPIENEKTKTSSTEENDSDGGTRKIQETDTSKEVLYSSSNEIITKTVKNPTVLGAIVIAEGASNVNIKTNIVSAVEAITGLATYRIQVFEMNS